MKRLNSYFNEVEEAYEEFITHASRAATYAEEHDEIEYTGELNTVALAVEEEEAYEMLEDELIEAQNHSVKTQDKINKLSKEMKKYRESKEDPPSEYFDLGDELSNIREQFNTLDSEITELMKQTNRTKREELNKQRSVIGNQEADRLVSQIPYEPKR